MNQILILPEGRFGHKLGTQVVDTSAINRVADSLKKSCRDVPVDFGHESFSSPAAPAAGWLDFKSLKKKDGGLYGKIHWTDDALEKISKREYRYLSPVLAFNPERSKEGELFIERIISIGLTNHPNIESMQPLFNQLQLEGIMDEQFEKLRSAMDMPKEATQAEMLERVMESLAKLKSMQEEQAKLKPAEPDPQNDQSAQAANSHNDAPPTRLEWLDLKAEVERLKKRDISNQVHEAVNSGKILPSQEEWAMNFAVSDPDGFRKYLVNSRPLVQMGEIIAKNVLGKAEPAALSPEQEKMNRLLGISRETFDKYNTPK